MAFSLGEYCGLMHSLRASGYQLGPVRGYFEGAAPPRVYLRHDVDRLPRRAVRMARAERELGATATYYFRCRRDGAFPEAAVAEVAGLGHEIGFHYETPSRHPDAPQAARAAFERELAGLRRLGVEVVTLAAHGSPLSSHSSMGFSRGLDLAALGLLGDPSEHMDFAKILYVTDTGGVYGSPFNRRDRVDGRNLTTPTPPQQLARRLDPRSEPVVLLSSHPERWPEGAAAVALQGAVDGAANALKRLRGWGSA